MLLPGATRQVLYADAIAFWITELTRLPAKSLRAKLKNLLEDRVREALGRKLDEVEDAVHRSAPMTADQLRFDSADLGDVQLPAGTSDALRLGPDHLTGFLTPAQHPTLQTLPGSATKLLVSGTLDLRTQIEIKGRRNVSDGLRQHDAIPQRLRHGWLRAGTQVYLVQPPTRLLHVLVAPHSERWAGAVKALHVQHPNRALAVQFPEALSGASAAYVDDIVEDTYQVVIATSQK